jgi:hypothetical protein
MVKKDYLKDISEIKSLMHKSTRFMSLTGLSGILAGIYALIGAVLTQWFIKTNTNISSIYDERFINTTVLILGIVASLSIVTAVLLSRAKAKKNEEPLWNETSHRLLLNFFIPLITGGLYILILFLQRDYTKLAALMLIFYGLSLISAAKYSINHVKSLGFMQIGLGLISTIYPAYSFWFWTLGFGLMHIIYGTWMYFKND